MNFTEVDPGRDVPEGDIGGDDQASGAWGRRFAREMGDGSWQVVTVAFYVEGFGSRAHMVRSTERLRCTDLHDPGGSEINSDHEWCYVEAPGATLDDAGCKVMRDQLVAVEIEWKERTA